MTALGGLLFYGITVQGRNAFYSPVDIFHALTYSVADTVPVSPVKKSSSIPVSQTRPTEISTEKILLNDTVPPKKDSVAVADSLPLRDSMVQKIDTFDLKMSKDSIDAPVDFEAEDWAEARDDVRKLRFFVKVMHDIDKAEDRFEDDDSFDLDDEF